MSRFSRRAQAAAAGNTSAPTGVNILIGKTFTSDIVDSISEPGHSTSLITDQNHSTRWISQPASPVNITVDMEAVYDLDSVVIVFAADTIQNYTVSISSNGSSWSTMATGVTNNTLSQTINHNSLSGTTQGRYLRITGADRWNSAWGNSIWEVEAYGTFISGVPVGTISNFDAVVASNTAINLTWTYSGSTLTNYTLKRNGTTIASPAAGATSYNDTGLTAGTPYSYTLVGNLQAGGTSNTASDSATTTGGVTGTWLSGASCIGAGDENTFYAWRGTPASFATTWSDNTYDNAVNAYQFWSGFNFENWSKSADWACGGIWSGDSWASAASGSMDAEWTAILNNIKNRWTAKSRGTLYIRFAHEMNGNWFPWSVNSGNINNFKNAWIRFYNLKQSIFPAAKLTFGTNGNTSGQSYDWRNLWPGDQYVDVYATDWYAGHYKISIINGNNPYDGFGGPQSLLAHRQFAEDHGVPFGISEWGVDHTYGTGDDPNYIQYVHDFCETYGGTGAGNLLYEAYFNLSQGYSNDFQLFYPGQGDSSSNPNAALRYRQLF